MKGRELSVVLVEVGCFFFFFFDLTSWSEVSTPSDDLAIPA